MCYPLNFPFGSPGLLGAIFLAAHLKFICEIPENEFLFSEVNKMSVENKEAEEKLLGDNHVGNSPSAEEYHDLDNKRKRQRCCVINWLLISIVLGLVVIILLSILFSRRSSKCPGDLPCGNRYQSTVLEAKPSPFDPLSKDELEAVQRFMLLESGMPLVPQQLARLTDAYIFMIDALLPPKNIITNYLDHGGPEPERLAKVVIFRGDLSPPRVEEHHVWNLPNPTRHALYRSPAYRRDYIPYSARPGDGVEFRILEKILGETTRKLHNILYESYGATHHNCTVATQPCLICIDFPPRGMQSGERKSWFNCFRDITGYFIQPVGFQVQIQHEGLDPSLWKVTEIYYNDHIFPSAEALLHAYYTNSIPKIRYPVSEDEAHTYSAFYLRGQPEPRERKRGPIQFLPDGPRYEISGHKIHYLNWEFHIRWSVATGLILNDIRFRGERMYYQANPTETAAIYGGYDPVEMTVNFYDVSYLMGMLSFELVPGVDCPEHATFLDMYFLANSDRVRKNRKSVCIFEHDEGIPLGRHYEEGKRDGTNFRNYAGLPDSALHVRSIATVWNYDYIFDYIFHQDGVVEMRVSATGYLQASYYQPGFQKYAFKVSDRTVAPLHHHIFNFRIDIDVEGEMNSLVAYKFGVENISHPWSPGHYRTQQMFTKVDIKTERQAAMEYNFNEPTYLVIQNPARRNLFGNVKGVKFHTNAPAKFLVPIDVKDRTNYANAVAFAKYQYAVTKFKDHENSVSSIYAQGDPFDPVVDFDTYIDDNESLVSQDLVAWVTMGIHHIPSPEDVPVTMTSWNKASIFLMPFNYHDQSPAVQSRDIVHIQPRREGVKVRRYLPELSELECRPVFGKLHYNGTTVP